MKKAFYAGAAILLIVALGLWWLYGRPSTSNQTNITDQTQTQSDADQKIPVE